MKQGGGEKILEIATWKSTWVSGSAAVRGLAGSGNGAPAPAAELSSVSGRSEVEGRRENEQQRRKVCSPTRSPWRPSQPVSSRC